MFVEEIDASRAYWDLETIGVKDEVDYMEDLQIVDNFNKTINQIDHRYEVRWPWKSSKYELPTNYPIAESRLKSLMKNSDKLKMDYDSIINKVTGRNYRRSR